MKFSLVVAADQQLGIGKNNRLPWQLPGDLKYFSKVTTTADTGLINVVIMGRKTWESLPRASQPLKNRINLVLSRHTLQLPEGVLSAFSLEEAFEKLGKIKNVQNVFIIGGGALFQETITNDECEKIYFTEVFGNFHCDTFFPTISEKQFQPQKVSRKNEENGIQYRFIIYKRVAS